MSTGVGPGNLPQTTVHEGIEVAKKNQLRAALSRGSQPFGLKLLQVCAFAVIVCAGMYMLQDIIAPVFLALTLVLTVRPVHRALIKKRVPPAISGMVTVLIIVAVLVTMFGLMAWAISGLPGFLRGYSDKFAMLFTELKGSLNGWGIDAELMFKEAGNNVNVDMIVSIISYASQTLLSASSLLFILTIAIFFTTIDTLSIRHRGWVLRKYDENLYNALASFEGRVRQYWLVATIFGLIVSAINYAVMLWLAVPMAFAWTLWTFVTNYIPNIGFIIGVIPPALVGLLDSGWGTCIAVLVIFTVVNVSIQGVVQPKIVGDAVGLSTTVTFVSLLFWAVVLGGMGTILAVPLTLFFKAVFVDSSPLTRWTEAFLIPEAEAKKNRYEGHYDGEAPVEIFQDFLHRDRDGSASRDVSESTETNTEKKRRSRFRSVLRRSRGVKNR